MPAELLMKIDNLLMQAMALKFISVMSANTLLSLWASWKFTCVLILVNDLTYVLYVEKLSDKVAQCTGINRTTVKNVHIALRMYCQVTVIQVRNNCQKVLAKSNKFSYMYYVMTVIQVRNNCQKILFKSNKFSYVKDSDASCNNCQKILAKSKLFSSVKNRK